MITDSNNVRRLATSRAHEFQGRGSRIAKQAKRSARFKAGKRPIHAAAGT